jgi:hypothetical protein
MRQLLVAEMPDINKSAKHSARSQASELVLLLMSARDQFMSARIALNIPNAV